MSIPRIGIVGVGDIFPKHARGFVKTERLCAVTAVCSRRPEQWDSLRGMLPGHNVAFFRNYQELMASDEVDAVDILLPHDLHLDAVRTAAENGKHILLEKVMARNIAEAQEMLNVCAANGVSLQVCHDRRFAPNWMAIKKIIDDGQLGVPLFYKLEHNQDVAFWTDKVTWSKQRDRIGGGAIMSCLTHQIDALRWFEGEIASVYCLSTAVPSRMEGESIGTILAHMVSGATASLTINWHTRTAIKPRALWAELIHITGSEGEAFWLSGSGAFVKRYDEPRDAPFMRVPVDTSSTGHENLITEWVRELGGQPSTLSSTGVDAIGTVMVAEAAYESVRIGQKVELPIDETPWGSKIGPRATLEFDI